jgi:AbrB family looped-hinge helix DNA binding protein
LRINQLAITLLNMVHALIRPTRQRARLTRQGKITVPKAVRDALGARPGDEIEFVPRGEELLVEVRPRRSLLDFAGVAAEAVPLVPGTAEELDELVDWGMAEASVARERRTRRGSRRPG